VGTGELADNEDPLGKKKRRRRRQAALNVARGLRKEISGQLPTGLAKTRAAVVSGSEERNDASFPKRAMGR